MYRDLQIKKYYEIFRISWKENLAYRFNVVTTAALSFLKILLAFILWKAIYADSPVMAGYTFSMMITYYILITFLTKQDKSKEISTLMAREIRNGDFTKYIIRPMFPQGHYFANILAKFSYIFIFNILATVLWALLFQKYFIYPPDIMTCLHAAGIYLLGLIFLALLNYFFVLLTFWVLEVTAFFMIKDHLIDFVSGALIPLNLLPGGIIAVFKYLPFYYVYYYPTALYLDQGERSGIPMAYIMLLTWMLIFLLINNTIYKKVLRNYDGVGI
jgi:ABC-2 type transport system permease protein